VRHDLAADLKAIRAGATVFPDPDPGVRTEYELHEVAEHAIERAIKAEALAWELVAALRRISEILDSATCRCRCGFCEYFNAQKRADKALAKAKEVLGDEAT
jgi:hypothetical protein